MTTEHPIVAKLEPDRRQPPAGSVARVSDLATTLDALERRRWHLWIVAGIFLLAVSAALVLVFSDGDLARTLEDAPAVRYGFLGVAVAFIIYVGDQERALRRLTRTLLDERVLAASMRSRIADLTTLSQVGRLVNSVLTMEEVLNVILSSAFELTASRTGSVMLLEGDLLRVAASEGAGAAPPGAATPRGEGVAGWVADHREPLVISGRLSDGQLPGLRERQRGDGWAVCVPLVVSDDLIGVLALERAPQDPPFSESEVRSIAGFADQAATAVANAKRYDVERRTAEEMTDVAERRSEFTATMVHELKKPLTAVIGYANLLRRHWDRLDAQGRQQAVESIEGQALRLVQMVDEVLRSASVEAGADLRKEPLDLGSLLEELAETAAGVALARDDAPRSVRVLRSDDGFTISADREALRHVYLNLLENAVKYSPPGSAIDVTIERKGGEALVHIRDRGVGIPSEDLPHVFERFRQNSRPTAGGVGLGLYIVRTLVHAHGGRVWAASAPGGGTVFSVALPLLDAPGAVAGAAAAAASSRGRQVEPA